MKKPIFAISPPVSTDSRMALLRFNQGGPLHIQHQQLISRVS